MLGEKYMVFKKKLNNILREACLYAMHCGVLFKAIDNGHRVRTFPSTTKFVSHNFIPVQKESLIVHPLTLPPLM
jgi:hypothetical protein